MKQRVFRIFAWALGMTFALSVIGGCKGAETGSGDVGDVLPSEEVEFQETGTREENASVQESDAGETPASESSVEQSPASRIETNANHELGHYEFNPHVFSKVYQQIYGDKIMESFFNLCDALRNGEDTFECASTYAYGWCTGGRLFNFFFPVASPYITPYYGTEGPDYAKGVGRIGYAIPKEEFLVKEKEFEQEICDILNHSMSDDYDDLEKVLALYEYMTRNYVYDYDMYENSLERMKENGSYRCLQEKQGICGEIAGLYSYLLLQCGVDAEECGGWSSSSREGHAWVLVNIGGEHYHVDPTWGLSIGNSDLTYFMMTDAIREERDGFPLEKNNLAGMEEYWQEYKLNATSDRFADLWGSYYLGMDRSKKVIKYKSYVDPRVREFYYGD